MGSGSSSAADPRAKMGLVISTAAYLRPKEVEEHGILEAMSREYSRQAYASCRNMFVSYKPPVFLSYERDHQNEVKELRSSLQREGFDCWLDLGQMGVGESLHNEIKKGVQRCRVVVLCFTTKYTQSKRCLMEVNLCNESGKRMIPIKLEATAWPPSGSMGQILTGDTKYIKLYQNQKSIDGKPWPPEKFKELVWEISRIVPPAEVIVPANMGNGSSSEAEIKPTTRAGAIAQEFSRFQFATSNMFVAYKPPAIFLSYNWDHKDEVIALRLSLLRQGFDSWIDDGRTIDGEDFMKAIAKGIQECEVVLLCVTPQYTRSDMCLTEALHSKKLNKNMIPILLEKIDWPPRGIMGAVLAGKVCIKFYEDQKPKDGEFWPPEKFNLLVRQISRIVRPDKAFMPVSQA